MPAPLTAQDHALALVARGCKIFRLRAGTKDGIVDKKWATSPIADVFDAYDRFSGGQFNFGVIASASGLVILDVDAHKGGLDSLRALELPPTFTVRSPRGGLHLYYRADDADNFSNGVENLGPGLDIRGYNGYVVGPGSTFEGKPYTVESDAEIAPLPASLRTRLTARAPAPDKPRTPIGDADPAGVELASRYLQKVAPAIEGKGGDNHTVKVAMRVLDWIPDPDVAFQLMAEHFNDRCEPPWELEDLEKKVENAARSKGGALGRDNPGFGFEPVRVPGFTPDDIVDEFESRLSAPVDLEDEDLFAPRPWIIKRRVLRKKISVLVAPGSVGKSLMTLQWAAAIALGGDFAARLGVDVVETTRVLVVNNEDEKEEMQMRMAAIARRFELPRAELKERIAFLSGTERPFRSLERDDRGRLVESPDVAQMVAYIKRRGVGVVVVDPLVDTHAADENSNVEMARVMQMWRRVMAATGCAIVIVHHTKKPSGAGADSFVGSADSGRGASAVINAARIASTLFAMTDKDADKYGIRPDRRNRYVRLDDAKMNLGLASPFAEWFERATVRLPNGEDMGALVPVKLKRPEVELAPEIARLIAQHLQERGAAEISLDAAGKLIHDDAMFSDKPPAALRKQVAAAFSEGVPMKTPFGILIFDPIGESAGVFRLE